MEPSWRRPIPKRRRSCLPISIPARPDRSESSSRRASSNSILSGGGVRPSTATSSQGGNMQIFETERLLIRPFAMDDVEDTLREIYTGSEVWGPKTREQVVDGVMMAMLMSRSPDDGP